MRFFLLQEIRSNHPAIGAKRIPSDAKAAIRLSFFSHHRHPLVELPGDSRKDFPQEAGTPLKERPRAVQRRSDVDFYFWHSGGGVVVGHVEIQDVAFFFRRLVTIFVGVNDVPVVPIKGLVADAQRGKEPGLGRDVLGASLEPAQLDGTGIAVVVGSLPLLDIPPAPLVDRVVDLQKGGNRFLLDALPSLALHGIEDLLFAGVDPRVGGTIRFRSIFSIRHIHFDLVRRWCAAFGAAAGNRRFQAMGR